MSMFRLNGPVKMFVGDRLIGEGEIVSADIADEPTPKAPEDSMILPESIELSFEISPLSALLIAGSHPNPRVN